MEDTDTRISPTHIHTPTPHIHILTLSLLAEYLSIEWFRYLQCGRSRYSLCDRLNRKTLGRNYKNSNILLPLTPLIKCKQRACGFIVSHPSHQGLDAENGLRWRLDARAKRKIWAIFVISHTADIPSADQFT